jgi:hypothetical protein
VRRRAAEEGGGARREDGARVGWWRGDREAAEGSPGHTRRAPSGLPLAVLGASAALFRLRRLRGWSRRRDAQLLVWRAPVVILGVGIGAGRHSTGRVCLLGAPCCAPGR